MPKSGIRTLRELRISICWTISMWLEMSQVFREHLQVSIKRVRKAREGEYIEEDYLPVSERNIDEMYEELLTYVHKIENPYLKQLTDSYFLENEAFIKAFKGHSAAKSVHHGFVGGLLEHTLNVDKTLLLLCKTVSVFK